MNNLVWSTYGQCVDTGHQLVNSGRTEDKHLAQGFLNYLLNQPTAWKSGRQFNGKI